MDSKSQGIKNASFSGAGRSVPLDVDTAKELGGGARGRTLAIIYRQLDVTGRSMQNGRVVRIESSSTSRNGEVLQGTWL